jgi:hypothetical protein
VRDPNFETICSWHFSFTILSCHGGDDFGVFKQPATRARTMSRWIRDDPKQVWIVGLLFLTVVLGGLGAGKHMPKERNEIEIMGRIYIAGYEPFTHVALEQDDGMVFILTGGNEKELRALQGKRLVVTGILGGRMARGAQSLEVRSYRPADKK